MTTRKKSLIKSAKEPGGRTVKTPKMTIREKILIMILGGMILLWGTDYVQSQTAKDPGPLTTLEYTQLADQALTSDVTTNWYNVAGFNEVKFAVKYVDGNSSITGLTYECQETDDQDIVYGFKTMSVAGGLITVQGATWTQAMSGSENWIFRLGTNCHYVRCIFSVDTGTPAAADKITINARSGIGG